MVSGETVKFLIDQAKVTLDLVKDNPEYMEEHVHYINILYHIAKEVVLPW